MDVSVKFTASGAVPVVGKNVKPAPGGGVAKETVTVVVAGEAHGCEGPEAFQAHSRTVNVPVELKECDGF